MLIEFLLKNGSLQLVNKIRDKSYLIQQYQREIKFRKDLENTSQRNTSPFLPDVLVREKAVRILKLLSDRMELKRERDLVINVRKKMNCGWRAWASVIS